MTRLTVRVTPRGGRDAVEGVMRDEAGRLVVKARVAAAPAEGAANEAVAALLAKALGRPKRDVRLVTGAAARVKQFEIDGIEAAEIEAALARVGAPRA